MQIGIKITPLIIHRWVLKFLQKNFINDIISQRDTYITGCYIQHCSAISTVFLELRRTKFKMNKRRRFYYSTAFSNVFILLFL